MDYLPVHIRDLQVGVCIVLSALCIAAHAIARVCIAVHIHDLQAVGCSYVLVQGRELGGVCVIRIAYAHEVQRTHWLWWRLQRS